MTDAFTTAARVEAEQKWPCSANPDPTLAEAADAALNAGFMTGTEWARDYLASQEVTDAELHAAILAFDGLSEHYAPGDAMRAALSAARAVRDE